jgi:hypothetical protein
LAFYKNGKRIERVITTKEVAKKNKEFEDIIDGLMLILARIDANQRKSKKYKY